jgi:hypothetical protein
MGERAAALYAAFADAGNGGKDFSGIIKTMQERRTDRSCIAYRKRLQT